MRYKLLKSITVQHIQQLETVKTWLHFYCVFSRFPFWSIPDEVTYEYMWYELLSLHSLVMFVVNDFFNGWVNNKLRCSDI